MCDFFKFKQKAPEEFDPDISRALKALLKYRILVSQKSTSVFMSCISSMLKNVMPKVLKSSMNSSKIAKHLTEQNLKNINMWSVFIFWLYQY